MGKKRNQQTSYLRGLLIKKLVTRTGIETSSSHFATFSNLRKMALQCDLQQLAQNTNFINSRNFL